MKISKQALLGTSVLLGGSVLLYATVQQVLQEPTTVKNPNNKAPNTATLPVASSPPAITNAPWTADLQTEKNLLAQKQKEREQRVQAQEQQAQQYLTEQQRIEAEALARSRAENQLYATKNTAAASAAATVITQPVVKPRPLEPALATAPTISPQATAAPVAPTTKTPPPKAITNPPPAAPTAHQVKAGEGLISLSRRYNIPVEVLATANNLDKNSSLHVGQSLTLPSQNQINQLAQQAKQREQQRQIELRQKQQENDRKKQTALQQQQQETLRKQQAAKLEAEQRQQALARKQQEAAQKEQKRQQDIALKKQEAIQKAQQQQQYQAAQDKLKQARQIVKETDAKGSFGVQVALATDQKKAQEITQKLQAAGYKVKTTQTSRGVRIVVGPEKGKVAALALKDKINNDSRVDVKNGWVLYW